jgi:hypothetical protein
MQAGGDMTPWSFETLEEFLDFCNQEEPEDQTISPEGIQAPE